MAPGGCVRDYEVLINFFLVFFNATSTTHDHYDNRQMTTDDIKYVHT